MNNIATPHQTPNGAPGPASAAAARAAAVMEGQIALLQRLAEAGAALAEAVPAPADGDNGRSDIAFSRISRAVRLTLALQGKIVKERLALERGEAEASAARKPEKVEPVPTPREIRQDRLARAVVRGTTDYDDEPREIERISSAAWERLEDEDVYGDILSRPMGELVELICLDLELPVDWVRLAREAWAVQEIESGVWRPPGWEPLLDGAAAAASPLHRVSRGPPPPMGEEWRRPDPD